MVCNCAELRAEMISQQKIMIKWFEFLFTKLQSVDQRNADIFAKLDTLESHIAPLDYLILRHNDSSNAAQSSKEHISAASILLTESGQSYNSVSALTPSCNSNPVPIVVHSDCPQPPVLNSTCCDFVNQQEPNIGIVKENNRDNTLVLKLEPQEGSASSLGSLSFDESNNPTALTGTPPVVEDGNAVEKDLNNSQDVSVSYFDNNFGSEPLNKQDEFLSVTANMNEGGLFRCYRCSCTFADENILQLHLKCHRRNIIPRSKRAHAKVLKCSLCGYETPLMTNFTRHLRTHSAEKPYSCQHCQYKSRRKEDVLRHAQSKHTAVKPFKCDLCDYRSALKTNVRNHWKRHHTLNAKLA